MSSYIVSRYESFEDYSIGEEFIKYNLTTIKAWPYNQLKIGDKIKLYSQLSKMIELNTEVVNIFKGEYNGPKELEKILSENGAEYDEGYIDERKKKGKYILLYKLKVREKKSYSPEKIPGHSGWLEEKHAESDNRKYFIIDTSANPLIDNGKTYEEKDFVNYIWQTNRFNKVREGDKFIYRRPQNASEIKGEFYFFGAGEIAKIQRNISLKVPAKVNGKLENCIIFDNYLKKSDLENFKWDFKERKKGSWGHFFNQYGMNEITKEDYNNLINLVGCNPLEKNEEILAYEEAQIEIGKENYYVEDTHSLVKTRQYHHVFAEKVKQNYDYKCPITGINEPSFLIASHIIPWSEKKETRLDPKNGICLYCDIDLAFDKGYISFNPNTLRLTFSKKLNLNKNLYNKLKQYEDIKLDVNYKYAPKKEYLEWHYNKYIL